jgi:hypothetical protein
MSKLIFIILPDEVYAKLPEQYSPIEYVHLPFNGFYGSLGVKAKLKPGELGPETVYIKQSIAQQILFSLAEIEVTLTNKAEK